MIVKDLKRIIENLPDDMPVVSLDYQGSYENVVAYIDGTGEDDDFPMEWLVVAVDYEEREAE